MQLQHISLRKVAKTLNLFRILIAYVMKFGKTSQGLGFPYKVPNRASVGVRQVLVSRFRVQDGSLLEREE